MIDRRAFVSGIALGILGAPLTAEGQQAGKVYRIGFLSPAHLAPGLEGFRDGMRRLGYVEGQNLVVEYRSAEEKFERLPQLAAELVRLHVDVIVAVVTQASLAAQRATATIPIVMVYVADPVGAGLVSSLARPGGNVTGTSGMIAEIAGKPLELLKEAVPKIRVVAALWNPANETFQAQMVKETRTAARVLGLQLRLLEARDTQEIARAFEAMTRERVDALIVMSDPVFFLHRARIGALALKHRIPSASAFRDYAAAGGLIGYGPSLYEAARRAATHVDKILKGAKPVDLPVEQPTVFELIINMKTAKVLGLTFPPSILIRADHVIE